MLVKGAHGVTPQGPLQCEPLTGPSKHLPFSPCTDGRTADPGLQRRGRWGPACPRLLDLGSSITCSETHDWTPRATYCMPGSPNPGQVPGYSHLPAGLLSFSTPKTGQEAELQRDSLARNGLCVSLHHPPLSHPEKSLRVCPAATGRSGFFFSCAHWSALQ